ncbi:MAG: hypothetical protein ACFCVA_03165 [Gammaproteobacteria bacterium]
MSGTLYHHLQDIYRYAAGVLPPHRQWHKRGPECTVATRLERRVRHA